MKLKHFITTVALLGTISSAGAGEWAPVAGVRAGMEISVPSGGRNIYKTGAGLNVGVVVQLPLKQNFYFEPGAYFDFMSMTAKDLVSFDDEYFYEGAANVYSVRLPFDFGYTLSVSDICNLDFSTGPAVDINISARQNLDPNFSAPEIVPDRTINLFDHGWKRVDAKWGFGIGATFSEHYMVGITAHVALSPIASINHRHIYRNSFAIILGYNF